MVRISKESPYDTVSVYEQYGSVCLRHMSLLDEEKGYEFIVQPDEARIIAQYLNEAASIALKKDEDTPSEKDSNS